LIGGWLQMAGDEAMPLFPEELNLDAYFEFPPHQMPIQETNIDPTKRVSGFAAHIYDYNATVDAAIDQLAAGSEGFRYRGVMTGWDNTARRDREAFAFHGATPTNFRRWLRAAVDRARAEALTSETAVFINAWNEWAEGSYLEPDRDFGHGWLEAVGSVAKDRLLPEAVRQEADCALNAQS
jgi:lipopolysaccharide biosynthesis protein